MDHQTDHLAEKGWILPALEQAARAWDQRCEGTKPRINADYWAEVGSSCDKQCCRPTAPGESA